MEFALSQAVASGDAFEHGPSECGPARNKTPDRANQRGGTLSELTRPCQSNAFNAAMMMSLEMFSFGYYGQEDIHA